MKSLLNAVTALALSCLMFPMGGCVSSRLVNVWHDSSFQAPQLGRILVIAVRKDATKRRMWEDAFSAELTKHGVTVLASYNLFPDAPPDSNQIESTARENGIDGILITARRPTEIHTQFIEGYITTVRTERYNYYWQKYLTYYQEIENPGYVDTVKVIISSIDVMTTGADGRLIWSGTSRTPEPGSVTVAQREIVRLVTSKLAQRNIINSQKD